MRRGLFVVGLDLWHVVLTIGFLLASIFALLGSTYSPVEILQWGIAYGVIAFFILYSKFSTRDAGWGIHLAHAAVGFGFVYFIWGLYPALVAAISLYILVKMLSVNSTIHLTGVLFGFWLTAIINVGFSEGSNMFMILFSSQLTSYLGADIWLTLVSGVVFRILRPKNEIEQKAISKDVKSLKGKTAPSMNHHPLEDKNTYGDFYEEGSEDLHQVTTQKLNTSNRSYHPARTKTKRESNLKSSGTQMKFIKHHEEKYKKATDDEDVIV